MHDRTSGVEVLVVFLLGAAVNTYRATSGSASGAKLWADSKSSAALTHSDRPVVAPMYHHQACCAAAMLHSVSWQAA